MISWFIKLSFQTFQPLIVIYRRGNYVWGSTSIYYPLSYPFISLLSVSTCLSINLVYLSHSSPCLPSPIPFPFCFPISFSYSKVAKIFSAAKIIEDGQLKGYMYIILASSEYTSTMAALKNSFILKLKL